MLIFTHRYCIIALMKIFKYKFTKPILLLIYAGIALCFIGLGLNTYFIATSNINEAANIVYPIIQYTLLFLIPIILLIILISLVVSSYYSIDDKIFKTSFGIIKSKYDVKEIQSIVLDRSTNKLAVSTINGNCFMIVVKEEWYQEFIDALCKANPLIEYSINSKNNDDEDQGKKLK